jgi:hypothetical protein
MTGFDAKPSDHIHLFVFQVMRLPSQPNLGNESIDASATVR